MSKPVTTKKAGEMANTGGRAKRQYFAGKKSFMKRRAAKAARRAAVLDELTAEAQRLGLYDDKGGAHG